MLSKVIYTLKSIFRLVIFLLVVLMVFSPLILLALYLDFILEKLEIIYNALYQLLEPFGVLISEEVAKKIVKDNPLFDTTLLFALGLLFYKFKKYQQFWYGLLETSFAYVFGYLQFRDIQTEAKTGAIKFKVVLTIFTVVYLTVRGVNNMDDGGNKKYWKNEFVNPIYTLVRAFASEMVSGGNPSKVFVDRFGYPLDRFWLWLKNRI